MSDTISRLREWLESAQVNNDLVHPSAGFAFSLVREKLDALISEQRTSESEHRMELWLGHGHIGLYGDDGEMQCSLCRADYKRDPLPELERKASEAAQVAEAKAAMDYAIASLETAYVRVDGEERLYQFPAHWNTVDESHTFVASRRAAAEEGS